LRGSDQTSPHSECLERAPASGCRAAYLWQQKLDVGYEIDHHVQLKRRNVAGCELAIQAAGGAAVKLVAQVARPVFYFEEKARLLLDALADAWVELHELVHLRRATLLKANANEPRQTYALTPSTIAIPVHLRYVAHRRAQLG
jgi:hypothetical protein